MRRCPLCASKFTCAVAQSKRKLSQNTFLPTEHVMSAASADNDRDIDPAALPPQSPATGPIGTARAASITNRLITGRGASGAAAAVEPVQTQLCRARSCGGRQPRHAAYRPAGRPAGPSGRCPLVAGRIDVTGRGRRRSRNGDRLLSGAQRSRPLHGVVAETCIVNYLLRPAGQLQRPRPAPPLDH